MKFLSKHQKHQGVRYASCFAGIVKVLVIDFHKKFFIRIRNSLASKWKPLCDMCSVIRRYWSKLWKKSKSNIINWQVNWILNVRLSSQWANDLRIKNERSPKIKRNQKIKNRQWSMRPYSIVELVIILFAD